MLKRLAFVTIGFLISWAASFDLAEASCAESSIAVAARQRFFDPAISALWRIDPACDVVETGLLLGADATRLAPVGQPIYGYRQGYQQEIPAAESGVYWVSAYARDEAGAVIRAPATFVVVAIPPTPHIESGGSHGAPPS